MGGSGEVRGPRGLLLRSTKNFPFSFFFFFLDSFLFYAWFKPLFFKGNFNGKNMLF